MTTCQGFDASCRPEAALLDRGRRAGRWAKLSQQGAREWVGAYLNDFEARIIGERRPFADGQGPDHERPVGRDADGKAVGHVLDVGGEAREIQVHETLVARGGSVSESCAQGRAEALQGRGVSLPRNKAQVDEGAR